MILDTNAVSDLFRDEPNLIGLLSGEAPHHLPLVVVGEYRFGLIRSRLRRELAIQLDVLIEESLLLTLDLETTKEYALIRDELRSDGAPIPENDIWIAALARQHDLPLVSNDTHFDRVNGLERRGW